MLRAPFVLIANLLRLLGYLWAALWHHVGRLLTRKQRRYVVIKFDRDYAFGPPMGVGALFHSRPTFLEFRTNIKRLARDPNVEGVVIVAEHLTMGTARLEEFESFVEHLRQAGKRVVAHLQMSTLRDYAFATAADEIVLTPSGRLYLFGLRMEQVFAAELLERVGVTAQFVHIGPFKTASHRFIHRQMTTPQRLMMQSLFDDLHDQHVAKITARRAIDAGRVDDLLAQAPLDAREAMGHGLVDGEVFRQNVSRWIVHRELGTNLPSGPERSVTMVPYERYPRAAPPQFRPTPLFRSPKRLAVMDLSGMIVMPDMNIPGQGTATIDPDEVVPRLRALRQDHRVAGVLLHINSPGGSALASDILWYAIRDLAREKPVVAYCSDVVASGGYYLAIACNHIVCRPATIAGSIGVIAGKLAFPGTLDRLGVRVDTIETDDNSTFMSATHALSDRALANLQRDARSFYRRFLQRVGQARNLPRRRLHRYARGRVYTGREAYARGLVDTLGGFEDAVATLARMCSLDPDTAPVVFVAHRRQTIKSAVRRSFVEHALAGELAREVGDQAFALALIKREPVLALMPYAIRT